MSPLKGPNNPQRMWWRSLDEACSTDVSESNVLGEFPEIVDKHRNNEIQKKTENSWELKFSLND